MSWKPLLEGELGARAWGAIHAVAADLRPLVCSNWDVAPARDAPLACGRGGVALFFAHLSRATGDAAHRQATIALLDREVDRFPALAEMPWWTSLHEGALGTAWLNQHLAGWLIDPEDGDPNADIDAALLDHLSAGPVDQPFDLLHGLVGIGLYGLERGEHESGRSIVGRVIELLGGGGSGDAVGRWSSAGDAERSGAFAEPHLDLGMAHGVSAICAFLSRACARWPNPRWQQLLRDCAAAIVQHQAPERAGVWSQFPSVVGLSGTREDSRAAWCYGDLPISGALLEAGRALGDQALHARALAIAEAAARIPVGHLELIDAGLCHGRGGVGHLFNRLFQATGSETLGDAARFWLRRALETRQPGVGHGGFAAWNPRGDAGRRWSAEPGLLNGAAGVGLALLAAVDHRSPAWDRPFLMDVEAVA